ncbi:hypothetical protein Sarmat_00869 [Rickettsiales endosymbiont of Paramecium tredecaurelia]|uniref:hypothetical protein n=1 Tax=Candidatus Sarmatiella mevalonica TaxID=2770581 RepID=UPI001921A1B5|nr:hypothetical protein [Candidatus Sarmatiella mevalonica]MBL3285005.1 hypothetical protein [Candidatus Sarmatiella mevalonica]
MKNDSESQKNTRVADQKEQEQISVNLNNTTQDTDSLTNKIDRYLNYPVVYCNTPGELIEKTQNLLKIKNNIQAGNALSSEEIKTLAAADQKFADYTGMTFPINKAETQLDLVEFETKYVTEHEKIGKDQNIYYDLAPFIKEVLDPNKVGKENKHAAQFAQWSQVARDNIQILENDVQLNSMPLYAKEFANGEKLMTLINGSEVEKNKILDNAKNFNDVLYRVQHSELEKDLGHFQQANQEKDHVVRTKLEREYGAKIEGEDSHAVLKLNVPKLRPMTDEIIQTPQREQNVFFKIWNSIKNIFTKKPKNAQITTPQKQDKGVKQQKKVQQITIKKDHRKTLAEQKTREQGVEVGGRK